MVTDAICFEAVERNLGKDLAKEEELEVDPKGEIDQGAKTDWDRIIRPRGQDLRCLGKAH